MKYLETQLKASHNYKEFGKFAINLKYLYENVLLVKYKKSYAPVPTIKRTNVSEDFVDVLLYLFDTEKIDYEKLKEMTYTETELFKKLIMKSGLYDTLKYDHNLTRENIKDVIEQYQIIKGHIEADNDNPELPIKAKKVLKKLKNYGKITEAEYNDIMAEL